MGSAGQGEVEAAPVPAGFAERGPNFRWAGNLTRQLPGLPPVCLPEAVTRDAPGGEGAASPSASSVDRSPTGADVAAGDADLLGLWWAPFFRF